MKRIVITVSLLLAMACASGGGHGDLTVAELADILGATIWRVPAPTAATQWTLDVENASPLAEPQKTLSNVHPDTYGATIALRPVGKNEYEFTLIQREGKSSGTITPCAEPEDSESICEGYNVQFMGDPVCRPGCTAFVVAELKPMIGAGSRKQIVIRLVPTLVITPGKDTVVIPVPR